MDGKDVRAARQSLGLSRGQAADLWGIHPRTLESIEQGRGRGDGSTLRLLETIIRYHRAFGPPPDPQQE